MKSFIDLNQVDAMSLFISIHRILLTKEPNCAGCPLALLAGGISIFL